MNEEQSSFQIGQKFRDILAGGWKWHVDDDLSAIRMNLFDTKNGTTPAIKAVGQSCADRRISINVSVAACETIVTACFEIGREGDIGFPAEITTVGPNALLDLCRIVVAGNLDGFRLPAIGEVA